MTVYPYGYNVGTKTMAELRERYEPKMHPEYARRLFPWLKSMGGVVGIGGGWRDTQPDRPGFAPDGKSFHQSQTFRVWGCRILRCRSRRETRRRCPSCADMGRVRNGTRLRPTHVHQVAARAMAFAAD